MTKHKMAVKIVRYRKKDSQRFNKGSFKKGDYTSAFDDGLVTVYKKGHWTKRRSDGGPFAVFDTTKNALMFILENANRLNHELQVFECKYKESTEKALYYKNYGVMTSVMPPRRVPYGTVFADEVKLTKRIQ